MNKTTGIGAEAMVVEPIVILHITVENTECMILQENTAGPQQTDTIMIQCGVTRFREVKETAPENSGWYLLVKIM